MLREHARELSFSAADVTGLLDYLCGVSHRQAIHFLWRPALRDPADESILELAVGAGCDAIVTHNVRDFAGARTFGVQVMTPAAFVGLLGNNDERHSSSAAGLVAQEAAGDRRGR